MVITWVAWIFALITAVIHLIVFVLEAFLITRSSVYGGVFKISAAGLPAVRLWAFGVGFYNLFLGTGMIIGVVAWMAGREVAGQTLVIYLSAMLALSGLVLFSRGPDGAQPAAWHRRHRGDRPGGSTADRPRRRAHGHRLNPSTGAVLSLSKGSKSVSAVGVRRRQSRRGSDY